MKKIDVEIATFLLYLQSISSLCAGYYWSAVTLQLFHMF